MHLIIRANFAYLHTKNKKTSVFDQEIQQPHTAWQPMPPSERATKQ